jgi:hypothetical protein
MNLRSEKAKTFASWIDHLRPVRFTLAMIR